MAFELDEGALFWQFLAVDEDAAAFDVDGVARQADHAFDVIDFGIAGQFENDDVALFDVARRQQLAQARRRLAEHEFIDEQMVADVDRVLH